MMCLASPWVHLPAEKRVATPFGCGGLNYYDHASRDLSRRLVQNFHGHHDLSLATLHVHLDDHNCMVVTALQGPTKDLQYFADHVIAERGVKYGRVITIPAPESAPAKRWQKATCAQRLMRPSSVGAAGYEQ